MDLTEKEIKRISLIIVMIILGVLVFFLLRPILLAIIGGLVLAYIFKPLYNKLLPIIKLKNLTAFTIAFLIILIIFIPLWFLTPIMIQQVSSLFSISQDIGYTKIVSAIFPTADQTLIAQLGIALSNFSGKLTGLILEYLNNLVLEIPTLALQLIIILFIFFYAMRDSEGLTKFFSELSPFSKAKESLIIKEFKNLTDSIVFGQVIIGFVQGGLAGLGFLIFGIDNVIVLTALAIFLSVLPILGPFIIWIPVSILLLTSGQTNLAIGYILYNLIIVSLVDNFLRAYLVSRKSTLSPAIILASMIGGVILFGILGIFLGPLIVSYFIMILEAYKDKSLQTLIHEPQ